MNGKHINVAGLKASVIRHKVLCVIMALALLTLMIPSGLRAHAETANDPQPQQEEQVQPQDESATGGETEEVVIPTDKEAEPAATEPTEEASQSSENADVTYVFVPYYGATAHPDWAAFYDKVTPIEKITVSDKAVITPYDDYLSIVDGENTFSIYYEIIEDGYQAAKGTIPPWIIVDDEKLPNTKIARLILQSKPTLTYSLSGVSHAGDVDCKFYDNGTEMNQPSFKTNKTVTLSDDKKTINYAEGSETHSITPEDVEGYTFEKWQKVEDTNNYEAFYKVNGGDYTINVHSDCWGGHSTRASVETYLLDDEEEIPALSGNPVMLYSSQEPQFKNDKLLFWDFNGVEHHITVKDIRERRPDAWHYIFGFWKIDKGIEDSSFTAWSYLVQSVQLSGTVVEDDANSGVNNAPVAFLANNEWGTSNHVTSTNNEGKFSFWVPKEATGNLVISKMGYKPYIQPITEPITENMDLGKITVEEEEWVDVTVKAANEDEHMGFVWVQQIGDIILPVDADVAVETLLPHETRYQVDEYGILTANFNSTEYGIHLAAILVPIAAPGYEFAHYQKNGQDKLEPGQEYLIREADTELNLTVVYQEDAEAITATVSSDDIEVHDSFDYYFYINDEIIDGEEGLYDLEGAIYPGANIYLDWDGTLYAYNYLEELDLEWGYAITSNPVDWQYEVDYFDINIDDVHLQLEPGSEIPIGNASKVDGIVHYKEIGPLPDVLVSVGPADDEQHNGFDWEMYVNEELVDYGEGEYGYEGPAYSGSKVVIAEDGTVATYNESERYGYDWYVEITPNPVEGYEFDYYEVWVDGEDIVLTPGEYEVPETDDIIYGTVNYKEVEYDDVLLTLGPANYEQHDGFNWTLYADDEIVDYGEDDIAYIDEVGVGTTFVVDEDGYVESYYLDEDGTEWVLELECDPAEGYVFDYYEIYVDGESYKLEPGLEYEIPAVDAITATVNYKAESPTPEPQPKPDKGSKTSPKTGDAMPFALVGGIAILAMVSAGYVLSRKFNK